MNNILMHLKTLRSLIAHAFTSFLTCLMWDHKVGEYLQVPRGSRRFHPTQPYGRWLSLGPPIQAYPFSGTYDHRMSTRGVVHFLDGVQGGRVHGPVLSMDGYLRFF